jgi:putative AlgH/UPF0301 family transcriptional regulator
MRQNCWLVCDESKASIFGPSPVAHWQVFSFLQQLGVIPMVAT